MTTCNSNPRTTIQDVVRASMQVRIASREVSFAQNAHASAWVELMRVMHEFLAPATLSIEYDDEKEKNEKDEKKVQTDP